MSLPLPIIIAFLLLILGASPWLWRGLRSLYRERSTRRMVDLLVGGEILLGMGLIAGSAPYPWVYVRGVLVCCLVSLALPLACAPLLPKLRHPVMKALGLLFLATLGFALPLLANTWLPVP